MQLYKNLGEKQIHVNCNMCIILFWQLIVRLSDGAGRVAAQSATVTINVIRNQNTPYFINEPYSRLIQENLPTGTSIYQVTARDNDSPVSFYSIYTFFLETIDKKKITGCHLDCNLKLFSYNEITK